MANSSLNESAGSGCHEISPETEWSKAWKTIVYGIIILVSLTGNSLVLAVVYKKRRMRTTTNFFIANMAASDMLIAVFAMPPTIKSVFAGNDLLVGGVLAQIVCKGVSFVQQISVAVSVLSLTAIAFDRFFAVVFPFSHIITVRVSRLMIVATWLISLTWAAPVLYTNRTVSVKGREFCYELWEPLFDTEVAAKNYTIISFVFLYAAPLSVITVLYTGILIELWRGNSTEYRARVIQEDIQRANKKVLKMSATVVVLFALFWLPVYIYLFYYYLVGDPSCDVSNNVMFLGFFLCQATSAVNPIIYAIFSENYRRGFLERLHSLACCSRKQILRNSTTEHTRVELYIL